MKLALAKTAAQIKKEWYLGFAENVPAKKGKLDFEDAKAMKVPGEDNEACCVEYFKEKESEEAYENLGPRSKKILAMKASQQKNKGLRWVVQKVEKDAAEKAQ